MHIALQIPSEMGSFETKVKEIQTKSGLGRVGMDFTKSILWQISMPSEITLKFYSVYIKTSIHKIYHVCLIKEMLINGIVARREFRRQDGVNDV